MTSDDDIRGLAHQAVALSATVDRLNRDSAVQLVKLAEVGRLNRRLIRALFVISAVIVLLGIGMAVALFGVAKNGSDVDRQTDRLDRAQTVSRQQALCPLYQVFLDSRSPQARAKALDPKKYDHAFDVIEKGYEALECGEFAGGAPQLGGK